jgi:DNA invertase Pin-like site-specific DNA recombinase
MYDADRALPSPEPAGNRGQPRLPGPVSAAGVTALGYVSIRGVARSDHPERRVQETAIHDFCARRGWRLAGTVFHVESPNRKGVGWASLNHAIERLGRGDADCLVVAQLERLCPSVAELGGILDAVAQANTRLVSLDPPLDTGTQLGRALARLLTSVSGWERTRRAAMTSAARTKVDLPHTTPPDLKRRIVRLRSAGMTLQAIADELNTNGIPTVRGGAKWRPSSVQTALGYKRPRPWTVDIEPSGSGRSRAGGKGEPG